MTEKRLMAERDPMVEKGPMAEKRLMTEKGPMAEKGLMAERDPMAEKGPMAETRLMAENRPMKEKRTMTETHPMSETRPITEKQSMTEKPSMERLLVEQGYLTEGQLKRAKGLMESGQDRCVEEILMELGYVTEREVLNCAGVQGGMEVTSLSRYRPDRKASSLLPPAFALSRGILPLGFEEDRLLAASAYPPDREAVDEAAVLSGMEVKAVLAPEKALRRALERTYGEIPEQSVPAMGADSAGPSFRERVESAPVVRMVNELIEEAFRQNASDIHVEPGKQVLTLRLRVNGDLAAHRELGMEYHRPMVTRLKLMGGMDIAEKRLPQDGKYRYERGEVNTDLRISTLPGVHGEKVALRLLGNDRDRSLMDIRGLGMEEEQQEVFHDILRSPHGMVLVTGPTGSGKSTTLYAALSRMIRRKINIVTVEDPVEKILAGTTQVQVNPKAGLTFARALRAILRQDPDVIMVGEMRDEETVSMGVRAAVTGHLVLSTLHTNDCVSALNRLRDMGVPGYMAAASLSGIVAQRLVKLLCPECRIRYKPDGRERRLFCEQSGREPEQLWRPGSCPRCNGTGYIRRTAVYELMEVDERMRDMIQDHAPQSAIRGYQERKGMRPLKEYALRMAERGETSMEEAEKILYSTHQNEAAAGGDRVRRS